KPLTDPYKPYPYFTQCNIFNINARSHLDLETVSNEGLTLAQATFLLNAQEGVRATCFHAGPADGPVIHQDVPDCDVRRSTAQFRSTARHVLNRPEPYLLTTFPRATLSDDNTGGGHFSPLAAYSGGGDALLVMDVARYKYPPFWVDTDLLWQAMATTDTSSGQHRGYIVVEVEQEGKRRQCSPSAQAAQHCTRPLCSLLSAPTAAVVLLTSASPLRLAARRRPAYDIRAGAARHGGGCPRAPPGAEHPPPRPPPSPVPNATRRPTRLNARPSP